MNCDRSQLLLYAVTDRAWVGRQSLYEQVESALRGGATMVQLREKQLDAEGILREARELAHLCKQYGVPFILNDNVDLALACGADGVHVGQDDLAAAEARRKLGPDKIVGVSAHNVAEALAAVRDGADYLGSGAVFGSTTKTNVHTLPHETLTSAGQSTSRSSPSAASRRTICRSSPGPGLTALRWSARSSPRRTSRQNAARCAR